MSEVRVRFAPSPTGNVHIGNIRAAIFNYLFARNMGGKFLLRVEDTDKERSTQEAVDALLECMEWLGLDYDETPLYQSTQEQHHLDIAKSLQDKGHAYRFVKGENEVTLFRMPWDLENYSCIRKIDQQELALHADVALEVDAGGVRFATISRKGKAVPMEACHAGYKDLKVFDADGKEIFDLNSNYESIINDEQNVNITDGSKITWTRHSVFFNDIIKGELSKPLDSMKDLVIVKSNGSPLFHLANICDDITQNMSHIIRGDDHVENTYRHVLIYAALGEKTPQYAHLPMIVNKQGKPYSKRDGDAFVGDFRTKGYTAECLFNYLLLLGWSPGDEEKCSREDAIKLFQLEKVKSTAAQMDMDKLFNLNGQYLDELNDEEFLSLVSPFVKEYSWYNGDEKLLKTVSSLMKSRTKLVTQSETWEYYFQLVEPSDEKLIKKILGKEGMKEALLGCAETLATIDFNNSSELEQALKTSAENAGLNPGKLNQPVRFCVTSANGGADLMDTLALIGKEESIKRLKHNAEKFCLA
ncbi:glutamate--tRNA ligase family protein [Lentisphaera marina]|uniref:glutamate--tRNA ligase n=1 Tax=Lentisphaera marina TaxID=1111041 RepID=UPI0023651DF1|nr:glutamate--tRNA ligase family protein [Lentisphaera marina]MDD7984100.1 glutamate--tRNA ligase family protein [Lentisphaera marina]